MLDKNGCKKKEPDTGDFDFQVSGSTQFTIATTPTDVNFDCPNGDMHFNVPNGKVYINGKELKVK